MRTVIARIFDYGANSTVASGSRETELDALKRGGEGTIVAHGGVS